MSTRTRNKEKTELIKLLTTIDKRMSEFETSVEDLKNYKETLVELDEEITNKKIANSVILNKLKEDLERNRWKTIEDYASQNSLIILSKDEHNSLLNKIERTNKLHEDTLKDIENRVEQEVHRAKEILNLEHQCEKAKLDAEINTCKREIESLNKTFTRMEEELKSQKELTAKIASSSTPIISQQKNG